MIVYDLDGVFLSDTNFYRCSSVDEYLELRQTFVKPIFVPQGEYHIITGRPMTDYPYTVNWIKEHLKHNMPTSLNHQNVMGIDNAHKYKAMVLEQMVIKDPVIFIESDFKQYEYLSSLRINNLTVKLFSDIIKHSIKGL